MQISTHQTTLEPYLHNFCTRRPCCISVTCRTIALILLLPLLENAQVEMMQTGCPKANVHASTVTSQRRRSGASLRACTCVMVSHIMPTRCTRSYYLCHRSSHGNFTACGLFYKANGHARPIDHVASATTTQDSHDRINKANTPSPKAWRRPEASGVVVSASSELKPSLPKIKLVVRRPDPDEVEEIPLSSSAPLTAPPPAFCYNCLVTDTSTWHKGPNGETLCNRKHVSGYARACLTPLSITSLRSLPPSTWETTADSAVRARPCKFHRCFEQRD